MSQKTLRLILGDQLNLQHSWFSSAHKNMIYVLMEVKQEQDYVMHHIQKIVGFFAAMRNFATQLERRGHIVIYLKLDDKHNKQTIPGNLAELILAHKIERFEYLLPDEYRLDEQLKKFCKGLKIETSIADTEHFYTRRDDVANFFDGKKQFIMENFYRQMRRDWKVLMNGKNPVGEVWNFDKSNRKKYDGKVALPDAKVFNHDVSSLKKMVDKMGIRYFGEINEKHFTWPLSRKEAVLSLDYFCKNLLPHFGTYEDALLQEHASLFHSRLSFALNTKMISPKEVIDRAVHEWESRKKEIDLAQIEGFVRQILGWREFMRGIYWAKMPEFETLNFFNHTHKMPEWFWTGETKMNCLKQSISNSLENAWAHHIQRLMVIGNFALLAGIHPDEVDEWYLGVYIDAIQWVEMTNTRGMSQFADGGIVGTKPYVSSGAYIHKMSDYCEKCHYHPAKKTGEKACPFNSLYWHFLARNEEKLITNQRISMVYRTLEKLKDKEELMAQAEKYLKEIEQL